MIIQTVFCVMNRTLKPEEVACHFRTSAVYSEMLEQKNDQRVSGEADSSLAKSG